MVQCPADRRFRVLALVSARIPCWAISQRCFSLARWVFFFLGITFLVSDWLGPKQPAEGENLIGHDAGSSEELDGEDVG